MQLTAPVELHEIGYYSGFREKNSMGLGCQGMLASIKLTTRSGA